MNERYDRMHLHCPQWPETRERFEAWWTGRTPVGLSRRPMLRLRGIRDLTDGNAASLLTTTDPVEHHTSVSLAALRMRHQLEGMTYLAEAFPNTNINLGAGSLALYLGSEPEFRMDTVWFRETIDDWTTTSPLRIDPDNEWWKLHLRLIEEQVDASNGEYLVNVPDLVENIDILSALRGPQAFCIDLIDNPSAVLEQNVNVQSAWERAYEEFFARTKGVDGSSSFTAFQIWGPGRTAKVQCDINAMIGPQQFVEFVQPMLQRQCDWLDFSLFHLDGPDALRHADALMEIDGLNCLQWTPGDGNPDGGDERWYPLYDKVASAGKGLHIGLHEGGPDELFDRADRLVRRYGPDSLYLLLPDMPEPTARAWLERAERTWT